MTEEKKKVEKTEAKEATKDAEVKQQKETVYATLSKIDVKPYIKKKMGLDYLSWATAWGLVKALATAGLGLDIYAGEDLPEEPAKKTPQRASSAPSRQYRQPRKLSKTQLENYIVEFSDGNKHTLKEIFKRAKTSEIVKDWIKSGKYDVTTGTYIKQLGAIYKAEQKIKTESQNSQQAPDQFEDIIAK